MMLLRKQKNNYDFVDNKAKVYYQANKEKIRKIFQEKDYRNLDPKIKKKELC